MKTVHDLNKWSNANLIVLMNAFRILFGIFIFSKGVQFAAGTQELLHLIQPKHPDLAGLILVHYVAMVHLAGGLLVIFGLLTRLVLLIQLPIFIGAVAIQLINGADGLSTIEAYFGLIGSLVFIVYGSGRFSADKEMEMEM